MKNILALLILFLPLSSFAVRWVERGNGGFVLQCPGKATQTYDLYEAQERFGHLDQEKAESVSTRMVYLLNKLAKKNPTRAILYLGWYETFFKDSKFVDGQDLAPIGDIGFGSKPKVCNFALAVFQRNPDAFDKQRYTIRRDLWNELDVTSQAALIMHELIYREAINFSEAHTTSESSRYLNALLNAPEFTPLSDKDYLEILQTIGFETADYAGFSVSLGLDVAGKWTPYKLDFYPNGNLKNAALDWNEPRHPAELTFLDNQCINSDSTVFFFESGKVAQVKLINLQSQCKEVVTAYTQDQSNIAVINRSWIFNEKGQLVQTIGSLENKSSRANSTFVIKGISFLYRGSIDSAMDFNDQGVLLRLRLNAALRACRSQTPNTVEFIFDGLNQNGLTFDTQNIRTQFQSLPNCGFQMQSPQR
jgi:hypothetical protein